MLEHSHAVKAKLHLLRFVVGMLHNLLCNKLYSESTTSFNLQQFTEIFFKKPAPNPTSWKTARLLCAACCTTSDKSATRPKLHCFDLSRISTTSVLCGLVVQLLWFVAQQEIHKKSKVCVEWTNSRKPTTTPQHPATSACCTVCCTICLRVSRTTSVWTPGTGSSRTVLARGQKIVALASTLWPM